MLIKTSSLKIPIEFAKSTPKKYKMKQHITYYKANKRLQKKLIVDSNYNLLNGYIDYLVAKKYKLHEVECIVIQSSTPFIKVIIIKVGVFESNIVDERHFGLNNSEEMSELYKQYIGNEYIKIKTYM